MACCILGTRWWVALSFWYVSSHTTAHPTPRWLQCGRSFTQLVGTGLSRVNAMRIMKKSKQVFSSPLKEKKPGFRHQIFAPRVSISWATTTMISLIDSGNFSHWTLKITHGRPSPEASTNHYSLLPQVKIMSDLWAGGTEKDISGDY